MIVAGAPNPLLWGARDPLDEYMAIGHSVRFNAPDGAYLTRTPTVSGNRQKFSFSIWLKLADVNKADPHTLLFAGVDGSNCSRLEISNSGTVSYSRLDAGVTATQKTSSRVMRDPIAHFLLSLEVDTTQATAEDRYKIFVDDQRITSWSSNTVAAQNSLEYVNHTVPHAIGRHNASAIFYLSGYISQPMLTDGLVPGVSSIGARHPRTNQFRPKPYTGTYGTNGFLLNFTDGSAATSSALGKDRSGNNNDWTPVNISVATGAGNDWLLDTPTNNFCTWNPLAAVAVNGGGGVGAYNITNGALVSADANSSNTVGTVAGTHLLNAGVWCWEVECTSIGAAFGAIGVKKADSDFTLLGTSSGDYVYVTSGGKKNNGTEVAYGAALATNDVVGFVLDIPAGTLTAYKNNVSQGVMFSGLTGPFLIVCGDFQNTSAYTFTLNAGQRPFTTSFPATAKAICTKNFPVLQPVIKSSNAFVAVTDSGANIAATLAAARPGWADYIEIFKRRDAAEGWRWRFSSDTGNYLDSSSTAAKAAFPALPGTSYVGYSLRVGAAYGVAAGTIAHVNGVPDTITDGLSNTRKMIILKREDAASSWFVYHPDLTAGKLLYLEQAAIENTDATISSVLAGSFVAAAALPSGTYRWIAIAEVDGFSRLLKYVGNGSAVGPNISAGHSTAFMLSKRIDSAGNHYVQDAIRSPYNTANALLVFEQASAESIGSALDLISSGCKIRNTDSSQNGSGGVFVGLTIASSPFRYANAR